MVKQITGFILIAYVAVWVVTGVLSNGILDEQATHYIQSTIDLPTAVALVAYVGLAVKLEIDKPKYRTLSRNKQGINVLLAVFGILIILILIYIKYIS
jgi:thiol:disulfide interchange protein